MSSFPIWSVIVNRKDVLGQMFWTEWRNALISVSTGAADAGAIPMLDANGQLDPSLVPTGSLVGDIDGGSPDSNYGGITSIDGGGV